MIGGDGTLELGNKLGAPGALSFAPGAGGTLLLDAGVAPSYLQINSFDSSDSFDIAGFDPATTQATFDNSSGPDLIVKNGAATDIFSFDPFNPAATSPGSRSTLP